MMFKQAALQLQNTRRCAREPINNFILSFDGLDEQHFRLIINEDTESLVDEYSSCRVS